MAINIVLVFTLYHLQYKRSLKTIIIKNWDQGMFSTCKITVSYTFEFLSLTNPLSCWVNAREFFFFQWFHKILEAASTALYFSMIYLFATEFSLWLVGMYLSYQKVIWCKGVTVIYAIIIAVNTVNRRWLIMYLFSQNEGI